ncbi:hypothetical protein SALWKB2_1871 [Snodgrassella alvi wkB2]|nr:hypothetical protein SALWKB2_1871 [Snodgrassella alvi wkB2]
MHVETEKLMEAKGLKILIADIDTQHHGDIKDNKEIRD